MNVAIIGGAGRMGRWLARYFATHGHKVTISDVKLDEAKAVAEATRVEVAENNIEAVKNADLILVSTPIKIIPKAIHEIASHVKRGAVVAEISSLKFYVRKALIEVASLDVRPLSLHPLFGPGAKRLRGRKIVVLPILDTEAETKLAKEVFPEAEIITIDAERHDQAMGLVLSLTNFMNVVFASVVSGEDILMLKRLGGTTFTLQLTLAESVMTQDPTLQASILMDNKHALPHIDKFLSKAKMIKRRIVDKDEKGFTAFCSDVQKSLSKDAEFFKSYENLYRALKAIR